jgi:hypothetical protein
LIADIAWIFIADIAWTFIADIAWIFIADMLCSLIGPPGANHPEISWRHARHSCRISRQRSQDIWPEIAWGYHLL